MMLITTWAKGVAPRVPGEGCWWSSRNRQARRSRQMEKHVLFPSTGSASWNVRRLEYRTSPPARLRATASALAENKCEPCVIRVLK